MLQSRGFRIAAAAVLLAAAAVVVRAENKPGFSPIKSLHTKVKLLIHQSDGKPTASYSEIWYVAPGNLRMDMINDKSRDIHVLRGRLLIDVRADAQAAVYSPIDDITRNRYLSGVRQKSASEFIAELGSGAKTVGEETVLGRACDMVQSPKKDGAWWVACIDRGSGLITGLSQYREGKLFVEQEAVVFEPDASIPESRFRPAIAKGQWQVRAPFLSNSSSALLFPAREAVGWGLSTANVRKLSPSSKAGDKLRAELQTNKKAGRKQELKQLYYPSYVPARFELLMAEQTEKRVVNKTASGTSYSYGNNLFDGAEIGYIDPSSDDMLVFQESTGETKLDMTGAVVVAGFDAKILKKSEPFPYAILTWKQGGVCFTLGGVNVDEAELVKIAKSVRAVK